MATLAEIRAQHPEYNDLSDQQLADGLYSKFYSDMPRDQFNSKLGLAPAQPAPAAAPPQTAYSGSILPLSKDTEGHIHFDTNAGLLGSLKRAFTLPGEVYQGKIDPLSPEGIDRAAEMAAVVSPVNPAVRSGDMAIPGMRRATIQPKMKPPTAEALYSAADKAYETARGMGVHYRSDAVKSVADAMRQRLEQEGIVNELAPKTYSIINRLANPPPNSTAPLSGLEAARRGLRHAGRDFNNPTDQMASGHVVEGLDQFMSNPPPEGVVAGPASDAADIITGARGNYAAAKRSEKLTGAPTSVEERADLNAAAANSGLNLDNAIRQRARDILVSPKQRAGFSADEIAALEAVARGSAGRNTVRFVGNLLGGGGGLGAVISGGAGAIVGSAAGAPTGAILGVGAPLVGYGAKKLANALTRRSLSRADEMVRSRSPLYSEWQRNAPMTVISPERRAALVRALLMSGSSQNQSQ